MRCMYVLKIHAETRYKFVFFLKVQRELRCYEHCFSQSARLFLRDWDSDLRPKAMIHDAFWRAKVVFPWLTWSVKGTLVCATSAKPESATRKQSFEKGPAPSATLEGRRKNAQCENALTLIMYTVHQMILPAYTWHFPTDAAFVDSFLAYHKRWVDRDVHTSENPQRGQLRVFRVEDGEEIWKGSTGGDGAGAAGCSVNPVTQEVEIYSCKNSSTHLTRFTSIRGNI